MNHDPNEIWEDLGLFEQFVIRCMYKIDPLLLGKNTELKLSYASFEDVMIECPLHLKKKNEIRKKHEYFILNHLTLSFEDTIPGLFTKTLWKAKQYQFRAGTNIDLGYYQAFKTYMKHVFIPQHKGILSEDELRRVQEDVDKAKRKEFLLRDPETREWVPYNLETVHRLSIAIRDA